MTRRRRQNDAGSTVRALVDVLVFAPLGFGAMLIEDAPKAIEQARQELNNARFVGRFTVDQGVAQMRNRLEAASDAVDRFPVPIAAAPTESVRESPDVETKPSADRLAPPPAEPVSPVADLALPDYDTLPAIDIVAKLETLDTDERAAIEGYETAHRQRRTVLGKLAQLAAQGSTE